MPEQTPPSRERFIVAQVQKCSGWENFPDCLHPLFRSNQDTGSSAKVSQKRGAAWLKIAQQNPYDSVEPTLLDRAGGRRLTTKTLEQPLKVSSNHATSFDDPPIEQDSPMPATHEQPPSRAGSAEDDDTEVEYIPSANTGKAGAGNGTESGIHGLQTPVTGNSSKRQRPWHNLQPLSRTYDFGAASLRHVVESLENVTDHGCITEHKIKDARTEIAKLRESIDLKSKEKVQIDLDKANIESILKMSSAGSATAQLQADATAQYERLLKLTTAEDLATMEERLTAKKAELVELKDSLKLLLGSQSIMKRISENMAALQGFADTLHGQDE